MKRALVVIAVLAAGLSAAAPASASLILAPGASWEYWLRSDQGGAPSANWETMADGSSAWSTGNAPFGNCTPATCGSYTRDFDYNTYWPVDSTFADDDLWVRTIVNFTGYELSTVTWDLGVDNGYKLYLDGILVASDNQGGYTNRWEYSGTFAGATTGPHIVAVALDDYGGLTAFDMQITGEPVPEPTTLILLGGGLAGLALRRRRQA